MLLAVCLVWCGTAFADLSAGLKWHVDFDEDNGAPGGTGYYWNNVTQAEGGASGYFYYYSGWGPEEVAGVFASTKGGAGAAQFTSGNSDYVYSKSTWGGVDWATIDPGNDAAGFAISIWSKLPGAAPEGAVIAASNRYSSETDGWNLTYTDTGDTINFGIGSANVAGAVTDETVWHNIIGSYDGVDTISIYVDGALASTTTDAAGIAAGLFPSTVDSVMALGWSSASSYVSCTLDDYGLWNRALGAADAAEIWNGGAGTVLPNVPEPLTLTLLGLGGLALRRRKR